ncbi:MAG: DUF2156 domain-containing protein [Clostridiales bacterium]|nr:DUF2156 domain-containing protein [Clostridiales bacterium]
MNIDFKEIELSDKPVIDHYLSMGHYENSEFSFSNMFIWRYAFNLRFTVIDDFLCVIGRLGDSFHFIFPPLGKDDGPLDQVFHKVMEYYKAQGFPIIVKCVTNPMRKLIDEAMPGFFRYERDRNNDDYIYRTYDLVNLEGRKYHRKRNHINKFLKNYEYTYENIDDSNIEECIKAEIEWMEGKEITQSLQDEKIAIMEALNNFHKLGLKGGALRIDGKIQAFSIGDLLNPEMALIHFEKANTDYHGSYAMINQQFAKNCWEHIPYINREEDMGIPGLRKAKMSYYPVKMIEKYTAYPAKE